MRLNTFLCQALILPTALTSLSAAEQTPSAPESRTVPEIGIELLSIPAGSFVMGSPEDDPVRYDREGPQTRVTLSRPFWLGKYELTHGQWKALLGTDLAEQVRRALADDTPYMVQGKWQTMREYYGAQKETDPATLLCTTDDRAPMYLVSWNEAALFCKKLTDREGTAQRLPDGYEYRLPTEAEWEYACRAGTTNDTYAGNVVLQGANNSPVLDSIAWYSGNSSVGYFGHGWDTSDWPEKQYRGGDAGPRLVGLKKPNAWGLYDILGNVAEWCVDWYDKYPGGELRDPHGPANGPSRVTRGGSWRYGPRFVRAPFRSWLQPEIRSYFLGFRVALAPVLK